jgi:hypothetical protein
VPVATGAGLSLENALRLGPLTVRTVGEDLLITGGRPAGEAISVMLRWWRFSGV